MIAILGGGPAGRIAAMRLAAAGKEVTLYERGEIGGQCLHAGCMPVCALNDLARFLHAARLFHDLGLTGSVPELRFAETLKEMRTVQEKIASILDHETRQAGVEIVYGKTGRLESGAVLVDDERVGADSVIVATGSRPNIPDAEGMDLAGVFNPHTVWGMVSLPQRLTIIGGGVMAAEFAYIFSEFGSAVTLISRSGFLKDLDPHLRALARKELAGVDIRENTGLCSCTGCACVESVRVRTEKCDATVASDAVLVTAGLVPRSELIHGVDKRPDGSIIVDDHMRTSAPGVYAGGDVTGPPYLTPVARHQGIVAADNILGIDRAMDYRFIPRSISLSHELAYCGVSGENAASLAIPGPAGPGTFWAVPSGETGLAKIMADPETGAIRGVCCAGPGGGLIAGYMAFLMQRHFSVHDFEDFIEVHPSTDGVYGLAKYASEILKKRNAE
ncbi:MAG TPA: NAD(P)/FAD-dependent oxidoreductase [Methanoregula sp.]|nr:NAD(P)/FAD-dependent oxidoreductase [Methanoregula sp.]